MKLASIIDNIWFCLQSVFKGTRIREVENPNNKLNYVMLDYI